MQVSVNQTKRRRPFAVFLLVLLVLFFAVLNLARAVQVAEIWEALKMLSRVAPVYLLLSGVVWVFICLGLALGLWRGWRTAWLAALPVFALYSAYAWIDRLVVPGYEQRNQNWPFMLGVNLLILALSAWILTRRKVRNFFGGTHEQPTPEQSVQAGFTIQPGDAGLDPQPGVKLSPAGDERRERQQSGE